MTTMVTFLFSKWGRYVVLGGVFVVALAAAYLKGRHDMAVSLELKQAREIQALIDKYTAIEATTEKQIDAIHRARDTNPSDDLDSCLLSNNPSKNLCDKLFAK